MAYFVYIIHDEGEIVTVSLEPIRAPDTHIPPIFKIKQNDYTTYR